MAQITRSNLLIMLEMTLDRLSTSDQPGESESTTCCAILERILAFQLKDRSSFFAATDFFDFILQGLSHYPPADSTLSLVTDMVDLKSPRGKGRAFIRASLMEAKLFDFMTFLSKRPKLISEWYDAEAMLRVPLAVEQFLSLLERTVPLVFVFDLRQPLLLENDQVAVLDLTQFVAPPRSPDQDLLALRAQLEESFTTLQAKDREIQALQLEVVELEHRLEEERVSSPLPAPEPTVSQSIVDDLRANVKEFQAQVEQSDEEIRSLVSTLEHVTAQRDALTTALESKTLFLKTLESENAAHLETIQTLEKQLDTARGAIEDLTVKCQELESKWVSRTAEWMDTKTHLRTLEQSLEHAQDLSAQVVSTADAKIASYKTQVSNEIARLKEEHRKEIQRLQIDHGRSLEAERAAVREQLESEIREEIGSDPIDDSSVVPGDRSRTDSELSIDEGAEVRGQFSLAQQDKDAQFVTSAAFQLLQVSGPPEWQRDETVTQCTCGSRFSVFQRRHHCRVCGGVFCEKCSSRRVQVPWANVLVRSCEPCAEDLKRVDS